MNAPATLIGASYAIVTGAVCVPTFEGLLVCGRMPGGGNGMMGQGWGMPNGAALTMGNTIYGGYAVDTLLWRKPELLAHETNHTWQWAIGGGGLGFVVPWLIGGGASGCNPVEQAAGLEGTNYDKNVENCG